MLKIFILLVVICLVVPRLNTYYSILIRKKHRNTNQGIEQQHVVSESEPRFDTASTFGVVYVGKDDSSRANLV